MKRRDFISASALSPALLRRRFGVGQRPLVRAAVVIGVSKTGKLPVLNAAASGADMVGDWLEKENFEVRRFVREPVTLTPIFEAVAAFVRRGTLDQLVVYFSGHGFMRDESEMWLLSNAPGNPNEAISLLECVALARETGIPSVVLISDACRSVAQTLNAQRVQGGVIFPNEPVSRAVRPEVDRFFAALPGDPALELPVDSTSKTFEGIYTSSFIDAFKNPPQIIVKTIDGVDVVPNRTLKTYLVDDVSRRAQARSVRLQQLPDAILECSESTYIAQVDRGERRGLWGWWGGPFFPPPPPPPPPPKAPATIGDVTATLLNRDGLQLLSIAQRPFSDAELQQVANSTGYETVRRSIIGATAPPSFETETGFAIHGVGIKHAVSSIGMIAQVLDPGDGVQRPAIIRLVPSGRPATSVLLIFDDGGATVIAALQGYIAAVIVEEGRVVNANYTPSRTSARWSQADYDSVKALRATVASAARFGTFRIEGNTKERSIQAAQLAERIRVFKGVDPSLGLYAAYAYADAGIGDQIESVQAVMRADLNANVFDVAMLAGVLSGGRGDSTSTVPFCPMLSQGWAWLRVRSVALPTGLQRARDYLRPALWTTFDSGAVPYLEGEIAARSDAI